MFTQRFAGYAFPGDSISCEVDGFVVTAILEHDPDAGPPDEAYDGFWPSLDPQDCGYIGDGMTEEDLRRETARAQIILDSWRLDRWFYCGVRLSVAKAGVTLDDSAASLWGIECNFPERDGGTDNGYLQEVANDLLPEALAAGRAKVRAICGC